MTQEQWGLFGTGVIIGVIFCACFVAGAGWMFRTIMKLQAAGFNILAWRDNEIAPEAHHREKSIGLDLRHQDSHRTGALK